MKEMGEQRDAMGEVLSRIKGLIRKEKASDKILELRREVGKAPTTEEIFENQIPLDLTENFVAREMKSRIIDEEKRKNVERDFVEESSEKPFKANGLRSHEEHATLDVVDALLSQSRSFRRPSEERDETKTRSEKRPYGDFKSLSFEIEEVIARHAESLLREKMERDDSFSGRNRDSEGRRSPNPHSVEMFFSELLRPYLLTWMDRELPKIVEGLVQRWLAEYLPDLTTRAIEKYLKGLVSSLKGKE